VKAASEFSVSVTTLADFACRSGDLVPEGVAGPTAREGIRAHQKLQRAVLEEAERNNRQVESEVRMSGRVTIDECDITITGRVDLVDHHTHRLSEIKTTLVPAEQVPEYQRALHWAQLYLYGYLYLIGEPQNAASDTVELELIHVNIRAQSQHSEHRVLHSAELQAHAHTALRLYTRWLTSVDQWRDELRASAALLGFPHETFRSGQRDMAAAVYRAARDAQALLCEAPTGIGKTVSALFPAIKMLGEGGIRQVAYLTAKVSGRRSALQSLAQMQSAGLKLTAVQIRAKRSACFCFNGRCERDAAGRCPMTLGFFDRLPAARDELLACGIITEAGLDDIAWQHQLCPFELALQLLPWVHVVVADYNYVFDPLVRLSHFAQSRSDTLLLVDESHNLVDRSRSMYSAEVCRLECMEQAMICRHSHPPVAHALDKLAQQLLVQTGSQAEDICVHDSVCKAVSTAAGNVIDTMVTTFGQVPALPESCGELFRILCRFVVISDLFAEHHRSIAVRSRRGRRIEVTLSLFCLDASGSLARQYRLFRASVLFSATLRPGIFYRDALGLPGTTVHMQLPSPFESARTCHCIVSWIDTRYRYRYASLPPLLEMIHAVSSCRTGNYLVFFPSYAYLNQAYDAFTALYPDVEVWKQAGDQTREQQQTQLAHLDNPGHRIGFAILGGVFGEGIDYVGERLIGVIVVSPGLPGLDTQTRLISEHYQQQGHDGFDFAYRYPGFTRVLQTVGRLVRDEADSGVAVLVDSRFNQAFYQGLFPAHWQLRRPLDLKDLQNNIERFWASLPCMDRQAGTRAEF
jgi:Rad3-related DNA helicase